MSKNNIEMYKSLTKKDKMLFISDKWSFSGERM
jgi:hypothetical protein